MERVFDREKDVRVSFLSAFLLLISVSACEGPQVLKGAKALTDHQSDPSEQTDGGAANLTYTDPDIIYTVQIPIKENRPVFRIGETEVNVEIENYSVDPALPDGLVLDPLSGIISGSSESAYAKKTFNIVALEKGGDTSYQTQVSIGVYNGAPWDLSYDPSSVHLDKGVAMDPLVPSVKGIVEKFTIAPVLPPGLQMDQKTGVITGTPEDYTKEKVFFVKAENEKGSTGGGFYLKVLPTPNPKDFKYSSSSYSYDKNQTIESLTPTYEGLVDGFSISPDLEAATGLSFDGKTGEISGTTKQNPSKTTFTVSAIIEFFPTPVAEIEIEVKGSGPSDLEYPQSNLVLTRLEPINDLLPTYQGEVTSFDPGNLKSKTGLSFDTGTGKIYGTPTKALDESVFTVTASGPDGSDQTNLTVTVLPVPVTTLQYPVTDLTHPVEESLSLMPTADGDDPSFSINPEISTRIPGLSFNTSTGEIFGAPTAGANETFIITASNISGSAQTSLSITVETPNIDGLSYAIPGASYHLFEAIQENVPSLEVGEATSYDISPTLPLGLLFDEKTGVISGIPTKISGTTTYIVTATNGYDSTKGLVTLEVLENLPGKPQYSFIKHRYLGVYFQYLNQNFTPNTTYEITPALPAGISFDSLTGDISGTPTETTDPTAYSVRAYNSVGEETGLVDFQVHGPPKNFKYLNPPVDVLPVGVEIEPILATYEGHFSHLDLASESDPLPPGLEFDGVSGNIIGTPTEDGVFNLVVEISNPAGSTKASLSIEVQKKLFDITYPYLKGYFLGTKIKNVPPKVSGGTPAQFSIEPSLPAGMSIDSLTGAILGTPEETQPVTEFTVTVTAQESDVHPGTAKIEFEVVDSQFAQVFLVGEQLTRFWYDQERDQLFHGGFQNFDHDHFQMHPWLRRLFWLENTNLLSWARLDRSTGELIKEGSTTKALSSGATGSRLAISADGSRILWARTYNPHQDDVLNITHYYFTDKGNIQYSGSKDYGESVSGKKKTLHDAAIVQPTQNKTYGVLLYFNANSSSYELRTVDMNFSLPPTVDIVKLSSSSYNIVVHPNQRYLYVSAKTSQGNKTIKGFSIGSNGMLTAMSGDHFPFPSIYGPEQMVIDPSGQYFYAIRADIDQIIYYEIKGSGKLEKLGHIDSCEEPTSIGVAALPKRIFLNCAGSFELWMFEINGVGKPINPSLQSRSHGYQKVLIGPPQGYPEFGGQNMTLLSKTSYSGLFSKSYRKSFALGLDGLLGEEQDSGYASGGPYSRDSAGTQIAHIWHSKGSGNHEIQLDRIDPQTGEWSHQKHIEIGTDPVNSLEMDPSGSLIFYGNETGLLTKRHRNGLGVGNSMDLGSQVNTMEVHPHYYGDGRYYLYVTTEDQGLHTVEYGYSNSYLGDMSLSAQSIMSDVGKDLWIDPTGRYLYVTHVQSVSVYNLAEPANPQFLFAVPLATEVKSLHFDRFGERVYAVAETSAQSYDLKTGVLLDFIGLPSESTVAALDPGGKILHVATVDEVLLSIDVSQVPMEVSQTTPIGSYDWSKISILGFNRAGF